MFASKKTKNKITILGISITLILVLFVWFAIGILLSDKLEVEQINIGGGDTQIKIAHISDIHYPDNKIDLDVLIREVALFQPDFVFLTGDMLTSVATKKDAEEFESFLTQLKHFRTFAVLGNHELILSSLNYYKLCLARNGIILLDNETHLAQTKDHTIAIVGISDKESYSLGTVNGLNALPNNIPILLLAHRPEKWENYLTTTPAPLAVFAGHAHGGQLQVFGKGIYAPGYGYFPKYYDGLYSHPDTDNFLIVSRGLGDSIFPFRLYNKYHLPLVTLSI
ncbi:MAG: metallophosphoesterase [Clostridia bacterium]